MVAEAGPELLEIVNSGVRVTPLTTNSRNLATNKNQIINYNNYTINATISNGYDVARLAEDLETISIHTLCEEGDIVNAF